MTKVIVHQDIVLEKIKPIEFVKTIDHNNKIVVTARQPKDYLFLELIRLGIGDGIYDYMFAHDGVRENGRFFLGFFNDGIVSVKK